MTGPTENHNRAPDPAALAEPRPVEAPRLRFDGVALVGSMEDGPAMAEDLTLTIDEQGVTVVSHQPEAERMLMWSAITAASIGAPGAAPHGRAATPLDLASSNRTVRFFLYGDRVDEAQVAVLRSRLPIWLGSVTPPPPPVTAPPPPPPPPPPGSLQWPVPPAGPPGAYANPYTYNEQQLTSRHQPTRRFGRPAALVVALGLIVAGIGLAVILGSVTNHRTSSALHKTKAISPDQGLANQLMLTQSDLPTGWQIGNDSGGTTQHDQVVQDQISKTFNQCMAVTSDQGSTALGGQAQDQTAQASSPPFVSPGLPVPGASSGTGVQPDQGSTLELQTDANIVRSHTDEQHDFALFTNPKFPQCNATAVASALQLGLNDASGGHANAGPATAKVVTLVAPIGEQVFGVTMGFSVSDGTTQIPVEVDQMMVGTSRIEAQLQALAIGTTFPSDVLSGAISSFEQRVAIQGTGTTA